MGAGCRRRITRTTGSGRAPCCLPYLRRRFVHVSGASEGRLSSPSGVSGIALWGQPSPRSYARGRLRPRSADVFKGPPLPKPPFTSPTHARPPDLQPCLPSDQRHVFAPQAEPVSRPLSFCGHPPALGLRREARHASRAAEGILLIKLGEDMFDVAPPEICARSITPLRPTSIIS